MGYSLGKHERCKEIDASNGSATAVATAPQTASAAVEVPGGVGVAMGVLQVESGQQIREHQKSSATGTRAQRAGQS